MTRVRPDVARAARERSLKGPRPEPLAERDPRAPAEALGRVLARSGLADPADLVALQRAMGNRAVQRLLHVPARHGPGASTVSVLQRKPARLDEFDDDFEEDDEVDDEAAEYLYDPTRNPHTLGLYLPPARAAADATPGFQAKQVADAKLKEAAEAKLEAEARAKEAAEAKARAEEETKAKEAAEAKARAAAEAQAKLEAEARAKEAAEAKARAEAEAKAKEAAEVKAREAAEAQARLEAEAREAAEAKARAEAETKAREAAEAKAKLEAEARAKAEAEERAKQEAAAKAKEEAAVKAKAEAEAKAAQAALAKKAEIREELRKKLIDNVHGTVVDQWAKLSPAQQEGFVQQVFDQKATAAAYQTAKQAATEVAKAAIRAQREAGLQADKVWLNLAVDALKASPDVKAMFKAAIDLHKESNHAFGLTIEKAYSEATIVAACQKWGLLENTQVIDPTGNRSVRVGDKLKVASNLHSPSWKESTIGWKERGTNLERTRNLIMVINGTKSNVHVHPPGGWQKKKK